MKRPTLIIGAVVVLVLLLAGAAFVGGRLLNAQGTQQGAGMGGGLSMVTGTGGQTTYTKLDMQPAPELPTTEADARGIYQRRADSSVFVGTGRVSVMAQKSQGGVISMTSNYDGPVVEVVLTHDTTVYKDVTMKQFNGPPPSGQKTQQVVEPGSIDEIGENSMVVVWGEKRGDRITARVLVYSLPAFITGPGKGGN